MEKYTLYKTLHTCATHRLSKHNTFKEALIDAIAFYNNGGVKQWEGKCDYPSVLEIYGEGTHTILGPGQAESILPYCKP